MSGALLEARGLRTGYGRLPVVFNVDLEVKEGEIVALLGANGAGKTTTLRALSGMLPLMAGDVALDGTSLKGRPANAIARGGIVHVPQGRGIFPNLRVDETLRLACAMAGIRRAEADARVADVYAIFERLHERRTQLAGTLVGRRAADARHRARADHEAAPADDRRDVARARADDRAGAVRASSGRFPSRACPS